MLYEVQHVEMPHTIVEKWRRILHLLLIICIFCRVENR